MCYMDQVKEFRKGRCERYNKLISDMHIQCFNADMNAHIDTERRALITGCCLSSDAFSEEEKSKINKQWKQFTEIKEKSMAKDNNSFVDYVSPVAYKLVEGNQETINRWVLEDQDRGKFMYFLTNSIAHMA